MPGSSHILPPTLTSSSSRPAPRGWAQREGLCPTCHSRRSPKCSGALHEKLGVNVKLINWGRCMRCHKKLSVPPHHPSSHLCSPQSWALAREPRECWVFLITNICPFSMKHQSKGTGKSTKQGWKSWENLSSSLCSSLCTRVVWQHLQGHGRQGTSIFYRGQAGTSGVKNRGTTPRLPMTGSVASPILQDKSSSGSSLGS